MYASVLQRVRREVPHIFQKRYLQGVRFALLRLSGLWAPFRVSPDVLAYVAPVRADDGSSGVRSPQQHEQDPAARNLSATWSQQRTIAFESDFNVREFSHHICGQLNQTNPSTRGEFSRMNVRYECKHIAVVFKVVSQLSEARRWVCHLVTPFCMMAHG
jgi:hypothetical protein